MKTLLSLLYLIAAAAAIAMGWIIGKKIAESRTAAKAVKKTAQVTARVGKAAYTKAKAVVKEFTETKAKKRKKSAKK